MNVFTTNRVSFETNVLLVQCSSGSVFVFLPSAKLVLIFYVDILTLNYVLCNE